MKRNKLLLGLVVAAGLSFSACNNSEHKSVEDDSHEAHAKAAAEIVTVAVNKEASVVAWKGTVVGMYSHAGTVALREASVEMTGKSISGGSFTVDMTSIVATDENFDAEKGKTPEKLVGHLSSADFFDVENYTTATFVIESSKGNTVTGSLTVRGKTNTETVEDISMTTIDGVKTVTGTLTFDRQKYGVAFAHPMKDVVIADDIELNISLVKADK